MNSRLIKCFFLMWLQVFGASLKQEQPKKSIRDLIRNFYRTPTDPESRTSNEVDIPVPVHCGLSRYRESHRTLYGAPEDGGRMTKRIVGGQTSLSGEWPWLVTMQLNRSGSNHEHLCGGSLIARQWILSAAHCFEPFWADFLTSDPAAWKARIGEHSMYEEDDSQSDVDVDRIIFHPERNPSESMDLDIVLVKLSSPVQLNTAVNVICLPSTVDKFPPGKYCLTAGWGHTQEAGAISSVVRHVRLPILNDSLCSDIYSPMYAKINMRIADDLMCAGLPEGGKDACQYDSGGPLVCYDHKDHRWILAGIVSTGFGCARSGYPGIYTRVSSHLTWIEDTIATN